MTETMTTIVVAGSSVSLAWAGAWMFVYRRCPRPLRSARTEVEVRRWRRELDRTL